MLTAALGLVDGAVLVEGATLVDRAVDAPVGAP
jgi:hypothetical protein